MVGKFRYYGRAVDPTLLVTLGSITPEQEKGTTKHKIQYTNFETTVQPIQMQNYTIMPKTRYLESAATYPNYQN